MVTTPYAVLSVTRDSWSWMLTVTRKRYFTSSVQNLQSARIFLRFICCCFFSLVLVGTWWSVCVCVWVRTWGLCRVNHHSLRTKIYVSVIACVWWYDFLISKYHAYTHYRMLVVYTCFLPLFICKRVCVGACVFMLMIKQHCIYINPYTHSYVCTCQCLSVCLCAFGSVLFAYTYYSYYYDYDCDYDYIVRKGVLRSA